MAMRDSASPGSAARTSASRSDGIRASSTASRSAGQNSTSVFRSATSPSTFAVPPPRPFERRLRRHVVFDTLEQQRAIDVERLAETAQRVSAVAATPSASTHTSVADSSAIRFQFESTTRRQAG
jgi:hypothetical protein